LAQPRTFPRWRRQSLPPKLEHELVHLAQLNSSHSSGRIAAPANGRASLCRCPGVHNAPGAAPRPMLPWCFLAAALGFATVLLLAS
jgi:hypothetical protein